MTYLISIFPFVLWLSLFPLLTLKNRVYNAVAMVQLIQNQH